MIFIHINIKFKIENLNIILENKFKIFLYKIDVKPNINILLLNSSIIWDWLMHLKFILISVCLSIFECNIKKKLTEFNILVV